MWVLLSYVAGSRYNFKSFLFSKNRPRSCTPNCTIPRPRKFLTWSFYTWLQVFWCLFITDSVDEHLFRSSKNNSAKVPTTAVTSSTISSRLRNQRWALLHGYPQQETLQIYTLCDHPKHTAHFNIITKIPATRYSKLQLSSTLLLFPVTLSFVKTCMCLLVSYLGTYIGNFSFDSLPKFAFYLPKIQLN